MPYFDRERDQELLRQAFKKAEGKGLTLRLTASVYLREQQRYKAWPGLSKNITLADRPAANAFRKFWKVLFTAIEKHGLARIEDLLANPDPDERADDVA
jgi:hypothetical protein